MTEITAAAAISSQSPTSTTYYAVALKPTAAEESLKPEKILPCAYFNTAWQNVDSNDIATLDGSDGVTFLQFRELPEAGQAAVKALGREPDLDVSLFAGVAKTLACDRNLPRTFVADDGEQGASLTVPVDLNTRRGVVLVFRRPAGGEALGLVATADPEIRNGSST